MGKFKVSVPTKSVMTSGWCPIEEGSSSSDTVETSEQIIVRKD